MSKQTVHSVAEAAAKAIKALHEAVGHGGHSPEVDAALEQLTGGESTDTPEEGASEDDKT